MTQGSVRGNITLIGPSTMQQLISTPAKKYNAEKKANEAKKLLRQQGLKL